MLDKPIFKSKRFISALVGIIVMLVVAYVPDLQPFEKTLVSGISDVVLALIAGYSLTDIVRDWLRLKAGQ